MFWCCDSSATQPGLSSLLQPAGQERKTLLAHIFLLHHTQHTRSHILYIYIWPRDFLRLLDIGYKYIIFTSTFLPISKFYTFLDPEFETCCFELNLEISPKILWNISFIEFSALADARELLARTNNPKISFNYVKLIFISHIIILFQ